MHRSRSPNFIGSEDVIFNEIAILWKRNLETQLAEQTDYGVNRKVELQEDSLETSIEEEIVDEALVFRANNTKQAAEPQHSIATSI